MNKFLAAIVEWSQTYGWRLVVIFALWFVASRMVNRFGRHVVQAILTKEQSIFSRHGTTVGSANIQRIETLSAVFIQILRACLVIIFGLMLLSLVGIPIGPLFAGAGLVGIALGFGLQPLIKDMSAGMLIVLENQYSKGEHVKIGDVRGTVAELSLRTTVLRSQDGVVHFIPNSTITVVSNFSKPQ